MDRWETGRARRREQVAEALAFEQERRRALEERRLEVITESVAGALDEAALAALGDDDRERVRDALDLGGDWTAHLDEEDAGFLGLLEGDEDAGPEDDAEEEVARLDEEIAECHARERALERFLEALASLSPPDPA